LFQISIPQLHFGDFFNTIDPKLSLSQSAKDHIGFDRDLAHNVANRLEASRRGRRSPTAGAKARFLL